MRAHIIENGLVTNTIVVDSLDALPGITLIDADHHGGGIGDLWNGTTLTSSQSLAEAKSLKYDQIVAAWTQATVAGLSYTFPDTKVGTIQTRDQIDLSNINGQVSMALVLKAQGNTTTALYFRDQQNVTHSLTPDQMMAMGTAVSNFINHLYQTKWQKQADVDALTTVAEVQAYDALGSWPTS